MPFLGAQLVSSLTILCRRLERRDHILVIMEANYTSVGVRMGKRRGWRSKRSEAKFKFQRYYILNDFAELVPLSLSFSVYKIRMPLTT